MLDPLAAFDDAPVEAAARQSDFGAETIRDLLRRQQRLLRDFPELSVEALVHDWRRTFPEDPLVAQDDSAYYLSVREHVWTDLVGRMELSDVESEALEAAHATQFRHALGEDAERVAVVVTK